VGFAWIFQLAFTEVHPKAILVFAGKPAPVIVIVEPTIAYVGETATVGVAAATLAGARTMRHNRAEIAVREIPMTFGLAFS
jgi:hypothetical protein